MLAQRVCRGTHCAPTALRSNNHGKLDNEACVSFGTPAHPCAALLGTARREPGHPTSTRAIAALGPEGRRRFAPRSARPSGAMARADFKPLVAAPVAGCSRGGMRVGARMLRELTRRGCSNVAAQQRSEFHGAPRKRAAAGLPRSEAQGSQTWGRFLLPSFLGETRKEGAPPGAHPGLRLQRRLEGNYKKALFRFGWSATVQKIVLTPLEQEPFRCKKHYFAKR